MKKIVIFCALVSLAFVACKKSLENEIVVEPDQVPVVIRGCMDPNSTNYNSQASEDDGSCTYLASSTVQKRNAVLEEFTGVRCTYCPDGHRKAQALADAHPGQVVLINVHTGSYANPQTGWPDFTTTLGPVLASISGLTGYPAGQMNRFVYTSVPSVASYMQGSGTLAMSRTGFQPAGNYQFTLDASVNIGLKSTFEVATRLLTVKAELYYTGEETVDNLLNVFLLENNVIGKQIDAGVTNASYVHKHMLRARLTPSDWGTVIPDPAIGNRISKTYTYTVPSTFVIENCDVAAFVTRVDKKTILNGAEVKAKI